MTKPTLVLMLATLGTACARTSVLPPEPDPLPAESAQHASIGLRVEGVVTDRWGYVVPDAWITVRVGSPNQGEGMDTDCTGASHLPSRTRTSPTGEFGVVVEAGQRPPFRACLDIEALPPRGLPWRENSVVVQSALFGPVDGPGAVPTVAVRVVLY